MKLKKTSQISSQVKIIFSHVKLSIAVAAIFIRASKTPKSSHNIHTVHTLRQLYSLNYLHTALYQSIKGRKKLNSKEMKQACAILIHISTNTTTKIWIFICMMCFLWVYPLVPKRELFILRTVLSNIRIYKKEGFIPPYYKYFHPEIRNNFFMTG